MKHYVDISSRSRVLWSLVVGSVLFLLLPAGVSAQGDQFTDEEVVQAVRRSLMADEIVSIQPIDVKIRNGIVTLSGAVSHILARDRAVQIAESIKGVQAVIDQLVVRSEERSDQILLNDVEAALVADPAADSYQIDIQVDDGVVTLSGIVDSYAEKHLAAQVVKGVRGVNKVENMIEVNPPELRVPEQIQEEIERRLELDPYVDAALLEAHVEDDEVLLSGTVGSVAEKSQATFDAWVVGVDEVDNSAVTIDRLARDTMRHARETMPASDAAIRGAVQKALDYDPRITSEDIQIAVDDQTVTLSGIVDNLRAKNAAEEDAVQTFGVRRVKNYLKVRPTQSYEDAAIAQTVRDALQRDPIVTRQRIEVEVFRQKVSLSGSVDSELERWRAEEIASRVHGVAAVENSLKVLTEWNWKSDLTIKEDVEHELSWNSEIQREDMSVTVENGVVTLAGTVEDWNEYRAAIDGAFKAGARAVQSYLNVQGIAGEQSGYYDRRRYDWN